MRGKRIATDNDNLNNDVITESQSFGQLRQRDLAQHQGEKRHGRWQHRLTHPAGATTPSQAEKATLHRKHQGNIYFCAQKILCVYIREAEI